jgi:cytidyltransferase-like protein
MFLGNLFEGSTRQVKVIYPGRFQPFHKGHAAVYKHLVQQYGQENVVIVTSDKTDNAKSPFSFEEKKRMMILTGVDSSKVVFSNQPYRATEIVSKFDPMSTIVLFAVSEKDMAEDPRFSFAPKKDGSPSFFQPFKSIKQCVPVGDDHAYMVTVPTFEFKVLGASANSASQIREQFSKADEVTQKKIVADLFGKFDQVVYNLMRNKLHVRESVSMTETTHKLDEISNDLAKSYLGGAMRDTITGKKDRNPGMLGAMSRMSGNYKPISVGTPPVDDTQNPDPKIRSLAIAVEKMKDQLATLQGGPQMESQMNLSDLDEARGDTIEAHGIRGMKRIPWQRTFKNIDALNRWVEMNDSVEVYGTRDTDAAKQGRLAPAVGVGESVDNLDPAISPSTQRKREANPDSFVGKKGTYKGYGLTQEGPHQWGISSSLRKFTTLNAAKRHIDKHLVEGYWQDSLKAVEKKREAEKGKTFEKNTLSHDKNGVYKGDKDLDGKPVPKKVAEAGKKGMSGHAKEVAKKKADYDKEQDKKQAERDKTEVYHSGNAKVTKGIQEQMLQSARNGDAKTVKALIVKLLPYAEESTQISESIDTAIRTVRRNAV